MIKLLKQLWKSKTYGAAIILAVILTVTATGSEQASLSAGTVSVPTSFRGTHSYKTNEFLVARDGGNAVSDTSGSIPEVPDWEAYRIVLRSKRRIFAGMEEETVCYVFPDKEMFSAECEKLNLLQYIESI